MRFLENSPDIPDELIRSVRDGEVMFLCGAGVSFGAGLPTFKVLTEQVYARLGEDLNYEHAEITAFNQNEFDRALRSLEKRTNLPGMDSSVRAAVTELLQGAAERTKKAPAVTPGRQGRRCGLMRDQPREDASRIVAVAQYRDGLPANQENRCNSDPSRGFLEDIHCTLGG